MGTCPKCSSKMVAGVMPDFSYNQVLQSKWIEGPMPKTNWLGKPKSEFKQVPIIAHRCSKCGFLELYANP
jgi:hypothetical protein